MQAVFPRLLSLGIQQVQLPASRHINVQPSALSATSSESLASTPDLDFSLDQGMESAAWFNSMYSVCHHDSAVLCP